MRQPYCVRDRTLRARPSLPQNLYRREPRRTVTWHWEKVAALPIDGTVDMAMGRSRLATQAPNIRSLRWPSYYLRYGRRWQDGSCYAVVEMHEPPRHALGPSEGMTMERRWLAVHVDSYRTHGPTWATHACPEAPPPMSWALARGSGAHWAPAVLRPWQQCAWLPRSR